MYRHEHDRISALVKPVHISYKRIFLKEPGKGRLFGRFHVFNDTGYELVHVVYTVGFLLARIDKHLHISSLIKHLTHERVKRAAGSKNIGQLIDR